MTSALFQVISPPGIENGGDNQDQIIVSIPGSGPIPWTTNRYNEGDIALQLAPFDLAAANEFLGTSPPWTGSAGALEYKYEDALQPQVQVWNAEPQVGIMLATAAQNVVSWEDGLPDYYPTVALAGSASGRGYDMVSGIWGAGGIDLNMGTWDEVSEANFSTATAWFPFEQGWIGGWMGDTDNSGTTDWVGPLTHSHHLESVPLDDVMFWTDTFVEPVAAFESGEDFGGLGRITLSMLGVHSFDDGMLFTISDDGSSSTNITSAAPLEDGSGWIYSNREDSQTESDILAAGDQSSFGFLYVPYDAFGLIGGHVNGDDASTFNRAGEFAVSRVSDGAYEIRIGDQTPEDGVLMLANADFLKDSAEIADNNHLSYQWNEVSESFTVEARHFDGEVSPEDTDFYFMWVDFDTPLQLKGGSIPGDCNGDGAVDAADLACIVGFGSGTIADVLAATGLLAGDLDADGSVAFSDFLILSQNFGEPDTGYVGGDIDGDGIVIFGDFLILSENFGSSSEAAVSVPETAGSMLIGSGLLLAFVQRRRCRG